MSTDVPEGVERQRAALRVAELEVELVAAKEEQREDLAGLKLELREARRYHRELREGVLTAEEIAARVAAGE